MKLNIYFRANESAKSAGSVNKDITQEAYRIGTHTKSDILRAVWLSVNNSGVTNEDRIKILCDSVSKKTQTWMLDTLKTSDFDFKEVPPLSHCPGFESHPFPHLHPVRINCSLALFELLYEEIEQGEDDDVFYLCEDDYLHRPATITMIKNLYQSGYKGFFLPYDYPDRYFLDPSKQCNLMMGAFGHLRTIQSSTLTMAAKGKTFSQYRYEILQGGVFAQDSWKGRREGE